MIFENNRYFSLLVKRIYLFLLALIISLMCLVGFLGKKLYELGRIDPVYVVFPDQTFVANRSESTMVRSEHELVAFARLFLEKALSHHEYSWEENVKQVTEWMDPESARMFVSKMDETVKSLYKERNAVSTVRLDEIEVNKAKYPHEILIYYTTSLKFLAAGKTLYEDMVVPGGVYFQLEILTRSYKNPYGLQVRKLKFLQPKNKEDK